MRLHYAQKNALELRKKKYKRDGYGTMKRHLGKGVGGVGRDLVTDVSDNGRFGNNFQVHISTNHLQPGFVETIVPKWNEKEQLEEEESTKKNQLP